jgi:hypothetical protein
MEEAIPADALPKDPPPSTKVCFFLMHKQNNPSLVESKLRMLAWGPKLEYCCYTVCKTNQI